MGCLAAQRQLGEEQTRLPVALGVLYGERDLAFQGEGLRLRPDLIGLVVVIQAVQDAAGEASTLDSIAFIRRHPADFPKAVTCYERAIQLHRRLGSRMQEAESLDRLGDTHWAAGSDPCARAAWQSALRLFAGTHDDQAVRVRLKLASPTRTQEFRLTSAGSRAQG